MQTKILILDGMWNKTLAIVRSLGKKGFYLTVGEKTRFATALFSRYCNRRVVYPSPLSLPDDFLDWLLTEIRSHHYEMIIPTELATQLLILKNRDEIEKYARLPYADYDLIADIQDKAWLMRYAGAKGYPCPKTYFVEDLLVPRLRPEWEKDKPLHATNIHDIEYPLVIKPRESSGSRGLVYVKRPSEFLTAFQKVHSRYPFPLVQEYVPNGGAFGVGALFNFRSEPRAAFVYKRLREYPVSGGPSTLRESVKNDEIKEIAIDLLKSLRWVGPAMVEFRIDPRDDRPKLMEINPRFWGSLHLAILSGMDFPYLLYKMAVDGDIEPVWNYKLGVQCRWLIPGDILYLISNLKRFKLSLDFFKRTDGDDIISTTDPMPVLGRVSSILALLFDKDMRRLIFR